MSTATETRKPRPFNRTTTLEKVLMSEEAFSLSHRLGVNFAELRDIVTVEYATHWKKISREGELMHLDTMKEKYLKLRRPGAVRFDRIDRLAMFALLTRLQGLHVGNAMIFPEYNSPENNTAENSK